MRKAWSCLATGEALAARCCRAGLTQTEAARRLGKSQSFLFRCESGERRVDFIQLIALAELYGVDISFFRP